MEAAAFYETAIRFSSSELIQCIKIISDNKSNPTEQIKAAQVSHWIQDALPVIEEYAQQLSQLAVLNKPLETSHFADIIGGFIECRCFHFIQRFSRILHLWSGNGDYRVCGTRRSGD
jgi:hypothetical protein